MKYQEQLKTSKWLEKKFEILKRDNYVCSFCLCDNSENRLEVHHITYLRGRKAWEYPDYYLITLCRECHENEHRLGKTEKLSEIMKLIIQNLQNNSG